jgi:hypothetical protein
LRAPHRVRDVNAAHGADFARPVKIFHDSAVLSPPAARQMLNPKFAAVPFQPCENLDGGRAIL